MQPVIRRLDEIAAVLAARDDTIALLGLGSCGAQRGRLDAHSDLDFFVIVEDGAKGRYLEGTDWLAEPGPVAHVFAHDRSGRRALYADGVFAEYLVLTVAELAGVPFSGARVVWRRPGAPPGLAESGSRPARPPIDTVEFHLNDALAGLYVGLHRELRGERLAAARMIQGHVVDAVLALLRLGSGDVPYRDPFDPSRRVERAYPADVLPLAEMVPGYRGNVAAARFTFEWLCRRYPVPSGFGGPIRELIRSADSS
ncbi:nucleotidyltransferase domain-containing protein [Actinoplanes sp. NPDC049802]|uniref:nucleotidyltransferase domain-containing protein n=1 Tax=Actinoplanes sp. NPDC049802 TaxID=3154742 RepID=UPI00340AB93F